MSLLLLLRSPSTTAPMFKYWNGTVESALTPQGVWDGSTVVSLGSTITISA